MAEPVNIELNPANWVTVLLIVVVTFTALGFLTRLYQQKQAQKTGA